MYAGSLRECSQKGTSRGVVVVVVVVVAAASMLLLAPLTVVDLHSTSVELLAPLGRSLHERDKIHRRHSSTLSG